MKARFISHDIGLAKVATLTISTLDKSTLRGIWDEYSMDDVDITFKKYRDKRSKDSNAMLWSLLGKIAYIIGQGKNDVYREYVRDYGVYDTITIKSEATTSFIKAWEHGTGWQAEVIRNDGITADVIAYYGTSSYDTAQMARILNAVVDECKDLGIVVETEEIRELLKTEAPAK